MAQELILPDELCLQCGGELDTGWECNDCGWDGIDWYYPAPFRKKELEESTR